MQGIYEATALALRFWFVVVAIIVLLGVTGISVKEYRDKRFVLGIAQNSIGYLRVISGPDDVIGENIQLTEKTVIGRSRRSDIVFADRSVDKSHSQIAKVLSGAVYLSRLGTGEVTVGGKSVDSRIRLYDGDVVCFGNVVTEVHIKEDES